MTIRLSAERAPLARHVRFNGRDGASRQVASPPRAISSADSDSLNGEGSTGTWHVRAKAAIC